MQDKTASEVFDEFHKVAGKIASGWASLESLVEAAVWEVIGLEKPLGRIVTRHFNFTAQLDVLTDLLRERHSEAFVSAEHEWWELVKRLHDLRRNRNAIVHGNWGGLDEYHDSPVIVGLAYDPKNDPVPKAIPYTLNEMIHVEDLVVRIWFELMNFVEKNFSIHPKPYEVSIQQMVEIRKRNDEKN